MFLDLDKFRGRNESITQAASRTVRDGFVTWNRATVSKHGTATSALLSLHCKTRHSRLNLYDDRFTQHVQTQYSRDRDF